mgnify:CR=1 FL=1
MGQKVNPIANRLGIIRGWDSNWFGGKDFSEKLVEDAKIRKYLNVRLAKASISKIIIERTLKLVTVTIATARPGIIIGKGGQEVDKLKEELKKLTGKEVQINIFEVKRPEVDAVIVGQNIARQLEGRVSFRRAVKTAIASTMRMGAEGIKVQVSGRVGGAEMARSETMKEGRIPLHTFRADIDYCLTEALTKVGILGVKVWICQGTVYGKRDLFEIAGASARSWRWFRWRALCPIASTCSMNAFTSSSLMPSNSASARSSAIRRIAVRYCIAFSVRYTRRIRRSNVSTSRRTSPFFSKPCRLRVVAARSTVYASAISSCVRPSCSYSSARYSTSDEVSFSSSNSRFRNRFICRNSTITDLSTRMDCSSSSLSQPIVAHFY